MRNILFLLLSFFALTLSSPEVKAENKPLRVGVILGLTGAASKWSAAQIQGIELAVQDFAEKGITIELVVEDSATQSAKAVTAFKKLTEIEKVDGIVGEIFSLLTEPLIPLADKSNVLLVSPATPKEFCEKTSGWFFSSATQVPKARGAFAKYFAANPKAKTAATIFFDDPGWGEKLRKSWGEIFRSKNIVLLDDFGSSEYYVDYQTILPRTISKKPDVIFVAHQPVKFFETARNLGYKGDAVFANNILELLSEKNFNRELLEGVYFVDTLANQDFAARYKAAYGTEPILEPYNGYEALRTLVKALRKDPKTPHKAAKTLQYEGISGPYDYTTSCAGNNSPWYLKKFTKGKITLVE